MIVGLAGGVIVSARTTNAANAQQSRPASVSAGHPTTWAGKKERLTPDNCVFAFVDHQTGLMNLVDNATMLEFKNYVVALGKTAKLFNVPVVITTSDEAGPNGPKIPELLEMFPDAPRVPRPGQINAWDNADFVAAIERTGRKKIVISGITTDVCVAFATLSAIDAGYEVYVVVDASGTMNEQVQNAAITRMAAAGAEITNWFAVSCELLSDWRNPEGAGSAQLFIEHLPRYGEVAASHRASTASQPAR
jgi:nicotinamidase-related amidase